MIQAPGRAVPSGLAARSGEWQEEPGFGVYVHIPFCLHRCHYCDFNTYEGQEDLYGPYLDALLRHIDSLGEQPQATSVFFGGGTPTLLSPAQLGSVLGAIRDHSGVRENAEITVEANPETVDERYFEGLLAAGFNRVSIGVQSLRPSVLQGLGRTHGPERALAAISAARRAGVVDVNADLIYGSPWESADDWRASLEGVIGSGVDHVSAYALTVEAGTPLATLVNTGRIPDVDPDVQADRFEVAASVLAAAGFHRYEISNWARPGRASAHNVLYWSAGDYLGVGAGAHGHRQGHRYWSVRLPRDFIARVGGDLSAIEGQETLGLDARAAEAAMLGLRLTAGIDVDGFERRFPGRSSLKGRIETLVDEGLLDRHRGRLSVPSHEVFRTDALVARLF